MRTAPAVSLVLGAAGLLAGATLFFSGGSRERPLFALGTAAILFTAAVAAAVLAGALPRPELGRAGVAFLVLLGAFTVWAGFSVQWSIAPDLSWAYFNRDLVYLAFAVLGVLAAGLAPRRVLAAGLALLLAAVIGWALLGKVVPALFPDGARIARLREPVDYWNALGLVCAWGVVLGLWVASAREFRAAARAGGVVLVYAASVAAGLTYSRAGIAVAGLAVVAWLVLGRTAFDSLVALALSVPAAVGVVAFAVSLPGVSEDGQANATRVEDGRLFGVVLVAVALGVFGLALAAAARPALPAGRERAVVRAAAGAAVVAAVVFASLVVVRGGGPQAWFETQWDAFRSSETIAVSNEAERLGSLGSNNRWPWWQEAWRSFRDEPVVGNGAGSFLLVHRLERDRDVGVTQPHNVPLQFLSDTGIIGFLLAAGALAAGLVSAGGTVRALEGPERGAVLALTLGVGAFVLHSLVDFDWDFLAVAGTAFLMLGAAVPRGAAATAGTRRPFWAAGALAIALVSASSLLAPWLADRRLDDAYEALFRGAYAEAAGDADDAHSLNPLDIEPLLVLGLAAEQSGRLDTAFGRYREAADLQPKNADAWLALGGFELERLDEPRLALEHLLLARRLDPWGAPAELDDLIARAEREAQQEPG